MKRAVLLTLLLACAAGWGSAQGAPLSEEAQRALRQGQNAAARAMSTYDRHFPDRPLWREAIQHGLEARRLAPDRLEPLRFLAQVYVTTGWHARAWEAWSSFQALGGELDAQARRQLAEAGAWLGYNSYSAGNLADALRYYRSAFEAQPGDGDIASWLGRIHFEQGEPEAALPYWEVAVAARPDQPQYRHFLERTQHQLRVGVAASNAYYRGVELRQRGQLQEALAAFRQATQANANFLEAFEQAAQISQALGRPSEAVSYWQRVLALSPNHPRAQGELALAEEQSRFGVAAVAAFREGVALFEQGNRQAAAQRFASATQQNASYAEAWAWRGRIAFEAGDYASAQQFYGAAARLEPGNERYAFYRREALRLATPPEPAPAVTEAPPAASAPSETAAAPPPQAEVAETQEAARAPQPEPEPPPALAEAPTSAAGPPLQLLDVTYTHPLRSRNDTSAFSFFESQVDLAKDLTAPVNYAGGTLRQRLEVISKPSDLPVSYQLCLVPSNISLRPACTDSSALTFVAPGIYEAIQPMSTLTQYQAIDWRQGMLNLMLIVKDGEGNPIDGSFPLIENWHGSPELELYYPMQVRYSAVIIPPGGQFGGWSP